MEKNKINILKLISPQMAEVLKKQEELAKDAFATNVSLEEIRENYIKERKFWNEGGPVPNKIVNDVIETSKGSVKIRIYYPNNKDNCPVIMYFHGGGFVVGNLDTHDRIMRIISDNTGAVVIGVDYSLSPEAVYPTAIIQCVDSINYIREHHTKLNVNANKMGLAGDSGGANLCMASSLYLRDNYGDNSFIKALLLYYGGFGLLDSKTYRLYGGSWDGLTRADLDYYFGVYIGENNPEDLRYYKMFDNDLTYGIPPAFIATAEFDPLMDDSLLLYEIMKEKNLKVKYKEYKGVLHAFLHHSRMLDAAKEALLDGSEFFKSAVS